MKNSGITKIPIIIVALLLISCEQQQPHSDSTVLARVGNEFLTLDYARSQIPPFLLEADSVAAIQGFQERWIRTNVLHQEAVRNGVHTLPDVKDRIRRTEKDILSEALRDMVILNTDNSGTVTNSDVQEYYEVNREQFVLQERYLRLRHLVTEELEDSRSAKNELMRGVEWETVVERYAENKSETLRRAQQFFPVSSFFQDNPPMRDYLRVMGITEISPIRGHEGQFHFIQIVEDRPAGDHPDIDWMFDQIKEWLEVERRRRAVAMFEQNLLIQAEANNEIEVFDVIPYEIN
ncbi:MAG: hypothetical protein LAT57_00700 [Balneolales bacterium]|nr:hypothetical protein [Balneolales bacterium]